MRNDPKHQTSWAGFLDLRRVEEACVPALKLLGDCGPGARATATAGDFDALGGLLGAASIVCKLSRAATHGHHIEDGTSGRIHQLQSKLVGTVGSLSSDRNGTTLRVGPSVSGDGYCVKTVVDDNCVLRLRSFGFGRHSQLERVADC